MTEVPQFAMKCEQGSEGLAIVATVEKGDADQDVAAALAFIRLHACEEIKVNDVLREIAVGRRTLEAKFRTLLNRTVLDEIHWVRIEKAKELLTVTDWPMAAVAKDSGFISAKRFAAVFRKLAGMAPTAYRRQAKGRFTV
jgi:LacI family transcriptional regulator